MRSPASKNFRPRGLERQKPENQIVPANIGGDGRARASETEKAVKRGILEFLKRERDSLAKELQQLQLGMRRVVYLDDDLKDITARVVADGEARLMRFEEIIAAWESGVT
jgi:hypothetical protein